MNLSAGFLALLAASFTLGAMHALEPGHGKTIMGAYLVASRGGVRHALLLGLVVTITHTAMVFLLAAGALYFSDRFQEGDVAYWLGIISASIVILVGGWMGLQAFGVFKGGHEHLHSDGEGHSHPHEHGHDHRHNEDHSPKVKILEGKDPLGFWTLVLVGASGGLVPCPAALAAFLAALNLGQPARGISVVVALSLGIAAGLITIGIVFVKARDWASRRYSPNGWLSKLPRFSAVLITLIGVVMLVLALYPHHH